MFLSKCLWQNWLQKQDFKMTSKMFVTSWYSMGFNRMIVKQQEVPLRQVTLAVVDGFMRPLSSKPLSRVSLATAAKILRRFAHYAYEQGWWPRDWAPAILSPRLLDR